MQANFKTVVEFYKPIVKLTHKQEVTRLYKRCSLIYRWFGDDIMIIAESPIRLTKLLSILYVLTTTFQNPQERVQLGRES